MTVATGLALLVCMIPQSRGAGLAGDNGGHVP